MLLNTTQFALKAEEESLPRRVRLLRGLLRQPSYAFQAGGHALARTQRCIDRCSGPYAGRVMWQECGEKNKKKTKRDGEGLQVESISRILFVQYYSSSVEGLLSFCMDPRLLPKSHRLIGFGIASQKGSLLFFFCVYRHFGSGSDARWREHA